MYLNIFKVPGDCFAIAYLNMGTDCRMCCFSPRWNQPRLWVSDVTREIHEVDNMHTILTCRASLLLYPGINKDSSDWLHKSVSYKAVLLVANAGWSSCKGLLTVLCSYCIARKLLFLWNERDLFFSFFFWWARSLVNSWVPYKKRWPIYAGCQPIITWSLIFYIRYPNRC